MAQTTYCIYIAVNINTAFIAVYVLYSGAPGVSGTFKYQRLVVWLAWPGLQLIPRNVELRVG